jgi:hypothetical protein
LVFDLRQVAGDGAQIAAVDRAVPHREMAVHMAEHAGRGNLHCFGLASRGLGVSHPREQLGQMYVLQLHRPPAGPVRG